MTYKKIILGSLLLSISSISFCEETIISKILRVCNIFKIGATLLQSKPTAAQPPKPTNSPIDPDNNASGAAVGRPNSHQASPPAPMKFDLYEAKKFLNQEADALRNSSICGTWYEETPSLLCCKSQKEESHLRYMLKYLNSSDSSRKLLEEYIKNQIKNLDESNNYYYLSDIRSDLHYWDDKDLLNYNTKINAVRKRLAQAYKNIFGKNI